MGLHFRFHLNVKYLQVILCGSRKLSFKSEDSRIRVHESGVRSDGPPERLVGHAHVDNDHAVLGRRLPNANVLVRLHGDVGERDELRIDANAGKRESLLHGDRGVGRGHGCEIWAGEEARRGGAVEPLRRSGAAMETLSAGGRGRERERSALVPECPMQRWL